LIARQGERSVPPVTACGSMNFVTTIGDTWGRQREPQIIMKTDERNVILELEREGKLTAKSIGWV
jgi:hypothetical protein